jgi:hypothetical protein
MISFFSRHKRPIFGVVVVIFVGSIFFVSGQVFTSSSMDAVAEIGGEKIPYQRFLTQVNRVMAGVRDSGTEVSEIVSRSVKQEVFREMVVETLLSQEGGKLGMMVPDFEVAVEVQNTPQFQEAGTFSPRAYYQAIYAEFQMTPAEYEAWRKKARLANKFKQFVYNSLKVTPDEVKAYYLAKNKSLRNFDKEKGKYAGELAQAKFSDVVNYHLRQLVTRNEVRNYLELREQGR